MSNDTAPAPPATEVSIRDVQQQLLAAVQTAIATGDASDAHCLAETYETLVRAETMEHHAVRAHVERALRQLEEAMARPNMAMPKAALEKA